MITIMNNNFNYSVDHMKIPSSWFDKQGRSKSVYEKIGGYKGLNLYIQLYKFRIHNQSNEHTFLTTIKLLQEQTKLMNKKGYTHDEIIDILKLLVKHEIIEIVGFKNLNLLKKEKKNIAENLNLHIVGLNYLPLGEWNVEERQLQGVSENDSRKFYIYVPLSMLAIMAKLGLDERHFALLLLIIKLKKRSTKHKKLNPIEQYCYMSLEQFHETLGISVGTIRKLLKDMNSYGFVVTKKGTSYLNRPMMMNYPLEDIRLNTMLEFEELHGDYLNDNLVQNRLSVIYRNSLQSSEEEKKQKIENFKMEEANKNNLEVDW